MVLGFVLGPRGSRRQRDGIRLRGVKGTTGTQASFLSLFDGDHDKVDHLERLVAERMGFSLAEQLHPVTGQTYPRLVDAKVLGALGIVAAACHKWATDVRLLAGRAEIEEPVAKKQIGSSAMPTRQPHAMRAGLWLGTIRDELGAQYVPDGRHPMARTHP